MKTAAHLVMLARKAQQRPYWFDAGHGP